MHFDPKGLRMKASRLWFFVPNVDFFLKLTLDSEKLLYG